MTRARTWPILTSATVAILALGLAALLGLGHPRAPMAGMTSLLPTVTLPAVIVGGLIDGINPCAFTVLVLFITALLTTAQVAGRESIQRVRARLIGMRSPSLYTTFIIPLSAY